MIKRRRKQRTASCNKQQTGSYRPERFRHLLAPDLLASVSGLRTFLLDLKDTHSLLHTEQWHPNQVLFPRDPSLASFFLVI